MQCGGILEYVRGATPCYTQVCGVVHRNPGGGSKAESRSTTATMYKSANDHPCDFTGSTCPSWESMQYATVCEVCHSTVIHRVQCGGGRLHYGKGCHLRLRHKCVV